jgi:hypothetical protein
MRMRYLAFAFAAAIAVLALQHGTARKSVLLSGDTMNILEMHMAAHKELARNGDRTIALERSSNSGS